LQGLSRRVLLALGLPHILPKEGLFLSGTEAGYGVREDFGRIDLVCVLYLWEFVDIVVISKLPQFPTSL
jgi:hypothetical protein